MTAPNSAREFVYLHVWPILDDDLPLSVLKAQAAAELGPELGLRGVRPVREPQIAVYDDRLVATVPVLRLGDDEPADAEEADVLRMLQAGHPVGHVAAELGVPRAWVEQIQQRLEAGLVGSPAEAEVTE